ncbi:MAG: VRR-NUC domain-containing protein [Pseudomonadota bacterium]
MIAIYGRGHRSDERIPPVTEAEFQKQVVQLAKLLGWETYHPWLSVYSAKGWPDLALCRPPRLLLAELKTEKGKVSVSQQRWLDLLGQCDGVEVAIWRPSDWPTIEEVLR